jgi:hypothetical protein
MVEIVSLDSIKDLSYNMDMAEEIDDANFMDQPIDIDNMRSRDEWGRQRVPQRFGSQGWY